MNVTEADTGTAETGSKRTRRKRQSLVRHGAALNPTPRRFALTTLRSVRREMARTYWQTRDGALSLSDGCKLTFILASLGKIIEVADIEARVRELEAMNHE